MARPAGHSVIRRASLKDAEALARVHHASWHAANAPHMPEDVVATNTLERRLSAWRDVLAGDRMLVLVSEVEEAVIGIAAAGPARDEDLDPTAVGELYAVYVTPAAWRRGHGHALHQAAVEHLRAQGYAAAILWVLTENTDARDFYERHGWQLDGREDREPERGVDKIRYRLDVR